MSLVFQKARGLTSIESWRADDDVHSFAIVKWSDGRYGASAKPHGGKMMDGSTHWLGGTDADRKPLFTSFEDAKAACERFQTMAEL